MSISAFDRVSVSQCGRGLRRLRCGWRRGFTVIELLAVVSVIAVLTALILPAVQQAREAARRTQCRNHLKQIAVALYAYHDRSRQFPVNSGNGLVPGQRPWQTGHHRKGTPLVGLLPLLDQKPFYDRLDFGGDVVGQIIADEALRRTAFPVFLCPSDQNAGGVPADRAMTNYAPSIGAQAMRSRNGDCDQWVPFGNPFGNGPASFGGSTDPRRISGVFARHSWAARFDQIRDGASQTIAFGEVRAGCNQRIHNGGWYEPATMFFATTIPINYPSCTREPPAAAGCFSWEALDAAQGFKSAHAGGAHFLLCDGAVRFISENISYHVYQKLGDRRDGQVIRDF
ncbi:MAG: DUF1559 domain-containing protein [Planctomycetes bacterium]|nr:DUF1559 domain-containing protein [Planctomycetota bacterium]